MLRSWLQAANEAEREQLLGELILVHATPLIKQTLRRKLGFRIGGANNPDAEDLYHDVIARLVQRLNELRSEPERSEIGNYRQFVTRVAANACYDYLRAKAPARTRLKNSLRDLLHRHRDFKTWRDESGVLLCGFAVWEKASVLALAPERVEWFKAQSDFGAGLQTASLARMVAEVFKRLNAPVELEDLVDLIAAILNVKDQPADSLDEESDLSLRLADPSAGSDVLLVGREQLRQVWEEVQRLSPKLREVFCLSFAGGSGEDLLSLLLDAQAVTLAEWSASLGWPPDRLEAIWEQMPMNGDSLATHLGLTRRQVIKLRYRAWQQLLKRRPDRRAKN